MAAAKICETGGQYALTIQPARDDTSQNDNSAASSRKPQARRSIPFRLDRGELRPPRTASRLSIADTRELSRF